VIQLYSQGISGAGPSHPYRAESTYSKITTRLRAFLPIAPVAPVGLLIIVRELVDTRCRLD
jgi:hypothetical protein